MPDIYTNRQMAASSPERQAYKAIDHALTTMRDNKHIAYFFGPYTATFAYLTEAYATFAAKIEEKENNDQFLKEIREWFEPTKSEDPGEAAVAKYKADQEGRSEDEIASASCCSDDAWLDESEIQARLYDLCGRLAPSAYHLPHHDVMDILNTLEAATRNTAIRA